VQPSTDLETARSGTPHPLFEGSNHVHVDDGAFTWGHGISDDDLDAAVGTELLPSALDRVSDCWIENLIAFDGVDERPKVLDCDGFRVNRHLRLIDLA
jgi:hypothetical protein